MIAYRTYSRRDLDRILRSLCRCDGVKDMAVVAALLVIAAWLAVELAAFRPGTMTFS
jgi:hypothetical protein